MNNKLSGKVAIVTGAGRGIGRAEALNLATEGAKVIVNDLGVSLIGEGQSKSPAEDVVSEIKRSGGQAIANYDSVATKDGAEKIIQSAIDSFGRIDILVNNAGTIKQHMIFNMTDEEWDEMMKVHLYGHFYCTRAACKWFRQQRSGRIINTSSSAGLGAPGAVGYSAAKEGIIGLTRSVALEMSRFNVTCNAIRPIAETRLINLVQPKLNEDPKSVEMRNEFSSAISVLRESFPEDISPLVTYLSTDAASNINGCTFLIRAGFISIYQEPIPLKTICKQGRWTVDELMAVYPETLSTSMERATQPLAHLIGK